MFVIRKEIALNLEAVESNATLIEKVSSSSFGSASAVNKIVLQKQLLGIALWKDTKSHRISMFFCMSESQEKLFQKMERITSHQ